MKKLVPVEVKCPHCRADLMDSVKLISNKQSIKVKIKTKDKEGFLWLCSFYGCYEHESDFYIPPREIVRFYCTHCDAELDTDVKCESCQAPMVTFNMKSGGKVSLCSRNGCDKHYVAFQNIDDAIQQFHDLFG